MELQAAIAELRPDLLQNEHRMAELSAACRTGRTWFRAIPRDLLAAYIVPMTRLPVRVRIVPDEMHARGRASYARFLLSILGPPHDLASWVAFRAEHPELRGLVYIRAAGDDYTYKLPEDDDTDCAYLHNASEVFPYLTNAFAADKIYSLFIFARLPCGLALCGVDVNCANHRVDTIVLIDPESQQHRVCHAVINYDSVVDDFGNIITHTKDYPAGFNEYSAEYASFMA